MLAKINAAIAGTACLLFICSCNSNQPTANHGNNLFEFDDAIETRWSSPENMNGVKGQGGKENNGAKGHAFDEIPAGASYKLLDIKDQGIINRI